MNTETFDAIVVGGGPAGSSSAAVLSKSGMRVAVLDRARFPRVKLCAGWLSAPIWDLLGTSPHSYPGSIWTWDRCHIYYGGSRHTTKTRGYFIRRYEFDDWLLSTSGAELYQHSAKRIVRDGKEWVIDDRFRSRYLIGAGGTHCPVARSLFPTKARKPVAAQELEFQAAAGEIAATRVGEDGEPEILLHADLGGYSWNVPKSDWLNVGCGTVDPKKVKSAWSDAREFFRDEDHVPESAKQELDHAKGHSYFLFDPGNLACCERDSAFLTGDALGLAQPLSAEGILPAILSGRLCAEAIVDGSPGSYSRLLSKHPVFSDYALLFRLREVAAKLRSHSKSAGPRIPTPAIFRKLTNTAIASGFAWMFSGQAIPRRPLRRFLGGQ